ncbi:MAG: glycoside hydrolase family 3 N-terminal domain-containing protein [Devosia sp.]
MKIEKFAGAPFHLDATGLAWVRASFERLAPDDKVRQLFCPRMRGNDPAEIQRLAGFRPGSMIRMAGLDRAEELALIARFNDLAPVPLLVSADLEGSRMSLPGATVVPNPLALAAIDDVAVTEAIGAIMAEEALASGINWTLTPVLDINAAFRSAIVATRGFGSDVETIERHALAQMRVFQAHGVAATVKHWPGEGYDDRDQHLVTTVNPLSMAEWEASFGRLYRAAIKAGAMSVMSAHIALPAFAREMGAEGVELFRPASISRHLTQVLLRERLGFEGLIVSDATGMAGLNSWSSRRDYLPEVVAAGSDIILDPADVEADRQIIEEALADGRLSWARVNDAVMRQLAMKAAIGLHKADRLVPAPDMEANRLVAAAATKRAPTLVKDVQGLLPLDPKVHKRVLVLSGGVVMPFIPEPLPFALPDMLRARGFDVTVFEPGGYIEPGQYDLMIYLFGEESLLTRNHIFLDWLKLGGHLGNAMARYWSDVPTLMISFGHPYYLYDAPRVPTYINAYMTTETMQEAVVEALLGNVPWNQHSPVDPYVDEQSRY